MQIREAIFLHSSERYRTPNTMAYYCMFESANYIDLQFTTQNDWPTSSSLLYRVYITYYTQEPTMSLMVRKL